MQILEKCKSNLAARLIPITNDLIRHPVHSTSHGAAARELHGVLALIERITKTQLEEEKLFVQGKPDAQDDTRNDIGETQAWMKSLGVWMASLEERLNEREARLQDMERLLKGYTGW